MHKKSYKAVAVIAVTIICGILDGCDWNEDISPIATLEAERLHPDENSAEKKETTDEDGELFKQNGGERPNQSNSEEIRGTVERTNQETYEVCTVGFTSTCSETPLRKNVFAVGGRQVWMCGSRSGTGDVGNLKDKTYFVGTLEAPVTQEDSWLMKNVEIEIPEGMRVFRMTADRSGNAHLLWESRGPLELEGLSWDMDGFNGEKYLLMVVSPDGTVIRETDITEFMVKYESMAFCFTVDDDGNYYIDQGKKILKFTAEGEILQEISCKSEVVAIRQGKSGVMYCVLDKPDGVERLYRMEADGTLTLLGEVPDGAANYPDIGAGTDTELILFRMDGGIYAVDVSGNEATFTLRVTETDMPVSGQDIGGSGILRDGRVCLFQYKAEGCLLHYIAVGR